MGSRDKPSIRGIVGLPIEEHFQKHHPKQEGLQKSRVLERVCRDDLRVRKGCAGCRVGGLWVRA